MSTKCSLKCSLAKFKFAVPVLAAMLGAAAVPAFAQQQGGGQGGGGGGGGGGPQQWRQQAMDNLKQQLGTTDDEFAAIEPKITAVWTAQRDANGGMMGMMGRGRRGPGGNQGGGGGGNPGAQSDVAKAQADLKTTLDNKDATTEDIKPKLEALRTARKAAKDTLSKAQEDLKSLLTPRQEAVMVQMGLLE